MSKSRLNILLSEYSFESVCFPSEENKQRDLLNVSNFSLIGYQEINEVINIAKETDGDYLVATHSISLLSLFLTNKTWTIKVKICNKTQIKEFQNKLNGQTGRFLRAQLRDSTGTIEAVAFNEEVEQLKSIKIGEVYFISNAQIKNSKPTSRMVRN